MILLLLTCQAAHGQDRPQFLGPGRNGVYAGQLPAGWPKPGIEVLWKVGVGQGFSAPVVARGRVILFHRREKQANRVSRIIREQGIDLYRQDFNFEPLAIWRANDAGDRQGITEMKHVAGYLAYWDELRRRFPAMLIDTCASGGRRNDLETLRRAVPLWRSDFAYEPAAMQQMTYGMALWIPYFGTAVNAVDPYIFRSQMTPAVGTGLDPARSEDGYRKLGSLLAEWRGIADYYYGDYYPLTPYSTESTAWMAWQFHRPEQGDGMVQVFRRPDSSFESARFRLRGLDPAARYKVVDMDSKRESEFSGRELVEGGIPVSIPVAPGASILTYVRLAP